MSKDMSREERLAAKLRENLRKRKAQAKGMAQGDKVDEAENRSDLSKNAKDS
ncbi:hypothetical protein [Erythrobacter alti]|uniref:hypothetical protein n=1 Tax=Erythrobacter alti TaxID=1896145 RepID=UPI0030F3DE20